MGYSANWSWPVAAPAPTTIGEDVHGRVAVVQESRVNAAAVQVWPGVLGLEAPAWAMYGLRSMALQLNAEVLLSSMEQDQLATVEQYAGACVPLADFQEQTRSQQFAFGNVNAGVTFALDTAWTQKGSKGEDPETGGIYWRRRCRDRHSCQHGHPRVSGQQHQALRGPGDAERLLYRRPDDRLHGVRPSAPVPHNGTLYVASMKVEGLGGWATPLIPLFNARAQSGANYRVIVNAPDGPPAAPPGGSTTGKLYFDVVGDIPNSVVYNDGSQDLLVWVDTAGTGMASGAPDVAGEHTAIIGGAPTDGGGTTGGNDVAPAAPEVVAPAPFELTPAEVAEPGFNGGGHR